MRRIVSIVLFFMMGKMVAQVSVEEQLGNQFLEKREYDKAVIYYEKLYDKDPYGFYPPYFKCLIALHDLKKAEKIAKKQLKMNPEALQFYLDLAQVYKADSNNTKAAEQYEKAVKELSGDVSQVILLGRAFLQIKEYDYALATFKKGRKRNIHTYPFFYETADVYKAKGDLRSMINEYLDAIEFRETELSTVQMQLQMSLGYDDEKGGFNNPILKQELQKRLAQHPDKEVFSEFLIFILLQQKDFEGASLNLPCLLNIFPFLK